MSLLPDFLGLPLLVKVKALMYRGGRCCLDPLSYQCCSLPRYNNVLTNPLFDYVKQQMECENMLVLFGIDILSTTYFLYWSTDTLVDITLVCCLSLVLEAIFWMVIWLTCQYYLYTKEIYKHSVDQQDADTFTRQKRGYIA